MSPCLNPSRPVVLTFFFFSPLFFSRPHFFFPKQFWPSPLVTKFFFFFFGKPFSPPPCGTFSLTFSPTCRSSHFFKLFQFSDPSLTILAPFFLAALIVSSFSAFCPRNNGCVSQYGFPPPVLNLDHRDPLSALLVAS